jgi:hypothetical protein
MSSGEEKGWEILTHLEPEDVCRRAVATFDNSSGLYTLKSFVWDISVSPHDNSLFCNASDSDVLLQKLGYFSRLSTLWYLVGSKDIPLSGQLVRSVNLKGGQLFFRGTHVLPLDAIAKKYGGNAEDFYAKGRSLDAEKLRYGDASVRLLPLPRVPVVLILWLGDDEFPARADILFDSTCELHLPLDIIWSVAMMSILIML